MEKPKKTVRANTNKLQTSCQRLIDHLNQDKINSNKMLEYEAKIVEAAIEAMYGKDAVKWIDYKLNNLNK